MKICYFGAYKKDHPRNVVLLKALRRSNIDVVECHSRHRVKALRYLVLTYQFVRNGVHCDIVYVAAMGHMYVTLAWILSRLSGKKLLYDPLVSMYDTFVNDRQLIRANSWRANFWWYIDKWNCLIADKIVLDTYAHVDYFVQEFNIVPEKFCVVPVGADDELFSPILSLDKQNLSEVIEVLYVGNFIPLHGIRFVLEAAKILESENYRFSLVGDGQELFLAESLVKEWKLTNVVFLPRIPRETYASMLREADIALGVFGASEKAKRVVPCKAYDALAAGAPLVTADTIASRYDFEDGVHAILCKPESGQALADSLRVLGKNSDMRKKIGYNGYQLFIHNFSIEAIGNILMKCLVLS